MIPSKVAFTVPETADSGEVNAGIALACEEELIWNYVVGVRRHLDGLADLLKKKKECASQLTELKCHVCGF